MTDVHEQADEIDLTRAIGAARRRLPLILLCMVVVAAAAFGFSKLQTKKYTATASVAFSNNPLSEQIAGLSSTGTSSSSLQAQQATDLELVRLGDMAEKTAAVLGHGLTATKVAESVSVAAQGESGVVSVSVTAESPSLAAAIANEYAKQFVVEQRAANIAFLTSALRVVKQQLAALSPEQRVGTDGVELQYRAQTLALLRQLHYGTVSVAQEAVAPTSPSSPKTKRNTLIGALLGLLVGLALALVLERLDRRLKGPDDLGAIYDLPVLGVVPESSAIANSAIRKEHHAAALPPAEAEAFGLIRAQLRFFNVGDRELRTVMIASAAPGDGKTTVAWQLAAAAVRLGSRVLLLEMDLRHPTLAGQLGLLPGPGLSDVLIGAIPMSEGVRTVDAGIPRYDGTAHRTLDVLPAGAILPPNPGEIIESAATDTLLLRAGSEYDLVIIDTPPLNAVPDAFSLLPKVDGVVLVGWVGRSRRDAAERLEQILARSGARLLGVVANGAKSGRLSDYAPASSLVVGASDTAA